MSRNIKTVKCLMKHIGETVHVTSKRGDSFYATVELVSNATRSYPRLKTEDSVANKDTYWWAGDFKGDLFCHDCAFGYQITKELKNLTLVTSKKLKEKAKKKTTKYLTKDELDAARGHFCLLADGSKGFICIKTGSEMKPTRVLHNSDDSMRWYYGEAEMSQDNAPEAIKGTFKYGYNAWDDEDAANIKVVEVLEKYDGRHYRYKKDTVKKPLTVEEIRKGIGHLCKLADGTTAFIAATEYHSSPVICMHKRSQDSGWGLDASDVASEFAYDIKGYKYGWGISNEADASRIKVVEILEKPKKEVKTVLDMTLRELLEKLDEIIKR